MKFFRRKKPYSQIEGATRLAAVAANTILTVYEHTVTYGVEDLAYVDQALSDLAAAGDLENKAPTIQAFGCLVGEILVRHDGGKWRELTVEEANVTGSRVIVEMPSGLWANPVGSAFKQAYGDEGRSAGLLREGALGPAPTDP
jgi:hypothetical protein